MDSKELVFKQEIKEEDEVSFELIEDQSYCLESVKDEIVLNEIEQEESCIDLIDRKSYFVVDGIKEEDLHDIQINDNMEFKEEEIHCEWSESTLNERDPLDLSEMQDTSLLPHYESAQSSSSANTNDTSKFRLISRDSEDNEFQRTSSPYSNNHSIRQHSTCVKKSLQPTTTRVVVHKYMCSECDYSSAKSYTLRRHKMTHTGEKPFICKECDYSCAKSSNLKTHNMIHTGEKPFICKECDYSCITSGSLKRNKMTHTGEKPFKCKECDYSCAKSSNLKVHKMIHTGEKPFKCKECDYSCSVLQYLKIHMTRHTGEKRFQCSICDYCCNRSHSLKCHMMTHTGEKPFKCKECVFSFSRSSHLK